MSKLTQEIDNVGGSSVASTDGRCYQSKPNCPYPMPTDVDEANRLDMQHYAIQQITCKRYHAPLNSPKRTIDVGTGSGIWIKEMAAEFPECEYLGIDITPLPPTMVLPQNCKFAIVNALEGLPYADDHFDHVRHSLLVAAIPKEKWQAHVEECARVCAPGGWLEMIEINGQIHGGGPTCEKFSKILPDALRARGLSPETADILDELMRDAGLVDVCAKEYKIPIGDWGGRAGELFFKNFCTGQIALAPLYKNAYGMTLGNVEQLLSRAEEEIKQHQVYMNLRVYLGRKP
ncbi:S-adenosyl-L-methionine-dependent methyltransferase [Thamnocephalis sphaerospora]|uniref:S-adenosyl-L-methionine-dependent methyltransferase n=1 Tax=Thamnocephalis sphaerospora TaxID=78915 RepID=A0A4P9XIN5_9FUNG|nr:S-adenosyl-L-methionine-dependent methyltransferase [Thamnocephalis sphaerospora]|eukprot:RKP05574.1 S-adenosyl-L-methionine-dependent methyltransferase [Thamnocephalis sphaerospora]